MGTRSLTFVYDGDAKKPNVIMYRHMDGYPSGHGSDLAKFLEPIKIVNGLPFGETTQVANGADCLAAQMVAHFKDGPGNIYLKPCAGDYWQDYEYLLRVTDTIEVTCRWPKTRTPLFQGTVKEFKTWCESE
jgi:hypothetical protein